MSKFQSLITDNYFLDIKKIVIDYNIVGTCAGVIVALVTKDLILSFVSDIIIPLFIFLFYKLNILPFSKINFNYLNFINKIITFILTLLVTFFIIKIIR